MQTLNEIYQAVDKLGLTIFLLVAGVTVWRFLRPKMEKWFDMHFELINTLRTGVVNLQTDSTAHKSEHAKTQKGIALVGNAILAAAPDARKEKVEPIVISLHTAMAPDDGE